MTDPDSTGQQCEVSWFSALCDDDYEFLGVPDAQLQSSWEHCRNIVLTAEEGGLAPRFARDGRSGPTARVNSKRTKLGIGCKRAAGLRRS